MNKIIAVALVLFAFSAKAQHRVLPSTVPDELIGKWVPEKKEVQTDAKNDVLESISFFANGKINIDSKKSRMVQGYKVVESNGGYAIEVTDLINGTVLANFKVLGVTDSTMMVNMQGKTNVRNMVLKKTKTNEYKVRPLYNN